MIFPEEVQKWNWDTKVVEIPENEREQYDGYSSRLDIENLKTFHKDDFYRSEEMWITKDLKMKINQYMIQKPLKVLQEHQIKKYDENWENIW